MSKTIEISQETFDFIVEELTAGRNKCFEILERMDSSHKENDTAYYRYWKYRKDMIQETLEGLNRKKE